MTKGRRGGSHYIFAGVNLHVDSQKVYEMTRVSYDFGLNGWKLA